MSQINQTEALYGFLKWLRDSPRKELIGAGHHGGNITHDLANFCNANNLPDLRDGWFEKVVFPERDIRAR